MAGLTVSPKSFSCTGKRSLEVSRTVSSLAIPQSPNETRRDFGTYCKNSVDRIESTCGRKERLTVRLVKGGS